MKPRIQLTPQAVEDLDEIWWYSERQSRRSPPRAARDFCHLPLAGQHPRMGHKRQDITPPPVRFWSVARFSNYVIVYRPETAPLQVVAVLHGKRDLKEVLKSRA